MTKFYSAAENGFYDVAVHGKGIPPDAVEITDEDYHGLLVGQSSGRIIVADNDGRPVLAAPIKPTLAEMWEFIKAERDRRTQTGGYPLDGFWFHSDVYSLSQQQGLILAAMQVQASGGDMNAPLMATPWYAMGGVPVEMTASLALRLLPAAMAQQVAIFDAAKAHKAALEDSADPACYDFSGGWPQAFGG